MGPGGVRAVRPNGTRLGMAVTEVMHDPERRDIPDRQEQRLAARGGPCLVCGQWIEPDAEDAYRVLVSKPPRQAEYSCHEACFEGIRHANAPAPG
jgi:hypothetical protein